MVCCLLLVAWANEGSRIQLNESFKVHLSVPNDIPGLYGFHALVCSKYLVERGTYFDHVPLASRSSKSKLGSTLRRRGGQCDCLVSRMGRRLKYVSAAVGRVPHRVNA